MCLLINLFPLTCKGLPYNRALNYIKSKKLNFEELDDRQNDFADGSVEGGDLKEDLLLEMEAA
jgi:hypothetical protein